MTPPPPDGPAAANDAGAIQDTTPTRASAAAGAPRPFNAVEVLARLWQQNLPLMRDRVATLERAAQEASTGPLSPERRLQASDLAHKLAGSLGMFGYPEGTRIARALEELLEGAEVPEAARLLALTGELRAVLPL